MSEQRKPVLTGGCQCGAVRYALYASRSAPASAIAGCARRRSAGRSRHGPMCATQDFAWTRGAPGTFRSSSAAERGFCARCGTPLCFRYIRRPGAMSVSIGSLDTPEAVALTQVEGIESRWANFDPAALPRCPRTGPGGRRPRGPHAHRDLPASGP